MIDVDQKCVLVQIISIIISSERRQKFVLLLNKNQCVKCKSRALKVKAIKKRKFDEKKKAPMTRSCISSSSKRIQSLPFARSRNV